MWFYYLFKGEMIMNNNSLMSDTSNLKARRLRSRKINPNMDKKSKTCSRCHERKLSSEFYKDKRKKHDKRSCWCKDCARSYSREYSKKYYIKHKKKKVINE